MIECRTSLDAFLDRLEDTYEATSAHPPLLPPGPEHLYIYGNSNDVYYVGITNHPPTRFSAHRRSEHSRRSSEVAYRPVTYRKAARGAEVVLVNSWKPLGNKDIPSVSIYRHLPPRARVEADVVLDEVEAALESDWPLIDSLVVEHGWHSWRL